MRKTHALPAADAVQYHVGAETAPLQLRVKKGVDEGEAVIENIEEDRGHERFAILIAAAAGQPIFDDAGIHKAFINHCGEIEHGHVGHAAVVVARVDIAAKQRILFGGGLGVHDLRLKVEVRRQCSAEASRPSELVYRHPHRNTCPASITGRPIGYVLASTKT